ncbi:MAG TPA: response regulator [Alphaproteobacteria bacterium]|nr:response regulator [Alphaproteobacteria bacterium]
MADYSFKSFRILVVDDSSAIRQLIHSTLDIIGVGTVEVAAHGGEAVDILKKTAKPSAERGRYTGGSAFDIVMTNMDMPTVDGMMLLRWIRRHEESPDHFIPVIVVSSYADPAKVREARDAGVTEFVAKPFTIASICSRLINVIERPRQFVQSANYFGPDRRRRALPYDGPDRRLLTDDSPEVEIING